MAYMGEMPRPPVQPPSLSNMMGSGEEMGGSAPTANGGGMARVVFRIEQLLDSLASADPSKSQKVDEIKVMLEELMTSSDDGGASDKSGQLDTGAAELIR